MPSQHVRIRLCSGRIWLTRAAAGGGERSALCSVGMGRGAQGVLTGTVPESWVVRARAPALRPRCICLPAIFVVLLIVCFVDEQRRAGACALWDH